MTRTHISRYYGQFAVFFWGGCSAGQWVLYGAHYTKAAADRIEADLRAVLE